MALLCHLETELQSISFMFFSKLLCKSSPFARVCICMQIFKKSGQMLSLTPNGGFGNKNNQGGGKVAIECIKKQTNEHYHTHEAGKRTNNFIKEVGFFLVKIASIFF